MVRKATYCRKCFALVALTPVGYVGPDPDFWVEKCPRCQERELEREAEEARKLALWAPRRCPQCGTAFLPKVTHQVFCTEKHRKQHHRQQKAAAVTA